MVSTELFWDYHTLQGQRRFQQIIYRLQVYKDQGRSSEGRSEVEIAQSCLDTCLDSLQSHGLYSPWNYPGQNTGVSSLSPQGSSQAWDQTQVTCIAGGFFAT